jgi:hypothetical protein
MTVEEIKGIIKELTQDVTEDNASSIASSLNELNQFIHEQFANSALANQLGQLSGTTKGNIKTLEERNQKLAIEISTLKTLLKQEEETEKKHTQLLIEKEKLKALEEKQKAIEELSQIQSKILDLTKTNTTAMQANIDNLKKLNEVLANANTDLEKTFAANALNAEKNLSAIQNSQLTALEIFDKSQLGKFGEEFMKQVTALIKDYNEYAEKVNQNRTNQEGVIALFKVNHSENVNIHEALKKRNEALGNLENLNREIKERLEKYDNEIKSLVEKRDQLPIYQLAETRKYQ